MPKKVYERNTNYKFRKNVCDIIYAKVSAGHKKTTVLNGMAAAVGVNVNVIKNWFSNDRSSYPDVEQGYDVACYFNTNLQKLITGEDPANIYSHPQIRKIVEILDEVPDAELLIEITGIVKNYIFEWKKNLDLKRASSAT